MRKSAAQQQLVLRAPPDYSGLLGGIAGLLETARRTSARAVNALMTATYWEIGRRIVEFEQGGKERAGYGEELLQRLSQDLTAHFGRGFSPVNLSHMKRFYLCWRPTDIFQTLSEKSARQAPGPQIFHTLSGISAGHGPAPLPQMEASVTVQTPSAQSAMEIFQTPSEKPGPADLRALACAFPLPWSHYVLLISRSRSPEALGFYHTEALRGGWTTSGVGWTCSSSTAACAA